MGSEVPQKATEVTKVRRKKTQCHTKNTKSETQDQQAAHKGHEQNTSFKSVTKVSEMLHMRHKQYKSAKYQKSHKMRGGGLHTAETIDTHLSQMPQIPYGRFHPGRELTATKFEFFSFAVKPINLCIFFQNCFNFVCVSMDTPLRFLSILFTSFTC